MDGQMIGKGMVVAGLILAVLGAAVWAAGALGWLSWLGRLPGDVRIERGSASFYFPVVTCLVISLILTLLANLFLRR